MRHRSRALGVARIDLAAVSSTAVIAGALIVIAGVTMTDVAGRRPAAVRAPGGATTGESAEIAASLALRPAGPGRA